MYTSSGKDRTPRKRPSKYDRKAPALKYLDRHEGPDDRPRNILSAKAIDPSRAMSFTGETVGLSAHGGGPTTHARRSTKVRPVSTLTDHVTQNRAKWLPKPGPVTSTRNK